MNKNNLFVRMWRAVNGADAKEVMAANLMVYEAANQANNTPEVYSVMMDTLGVDEFEKLFPKSDPLNSKLIWKEGIDPALWGDLLLKGHCDHNVHNSATRWIKNVTQFAAAGGKFLNLADEYGNRPTDYILNDAHKAYKTGYSNGGCPIENAKRIAILTKLGFTFETTSNFVLEYVQPQRMSKYTGEYRNAGRAYYEHKRPDEEVLNRLRNDIGEVSNPISVTQKLDA